MNTTKSNSCLSLVLFFVAAIVAFRAVGAPQIIPKDALVLEKKLIVRQFADPKGKVLATLKSCDEVLLLETTGKTKGSYSEILFLSDDAQKVRRGWVRKDAALYIFPEPRPSLPRTDTTPQVAFPWKEKAPEPGDPDYARVTSKDFLFTCLEKPHPAKANAVLGQIFDRYLEELKVEEVLKLLPLLRYAKESDYARIRQLLAKFKDNVTIADFIKANPIFGQVIEPEPTMAPILTVTPTPPPKEEVNPMSPMIKKVGIGAGALAAILILIALIVRSRKKKSSAGPDSGGPSID